ncbi:erythromycin esterase family protein [Streptomyces spectabilis]|uniref:Erythromycin esterase family protein n=1 Tax=Streptomyces spectabilis TaxID=68270 RepID=A0A516RJK6_STRST|nr:erythromycin esterase family protein [Streptomyces spectabilis]QDQ15829.1 erythromycin esterase family protein [Streptomyces spectabilis]
MTNDSTALQESLPLRVENPGQQRVNDGPLSGAALDALAEALAAEATIVGIGESTRFSRETFGIRDQLFRRLVRQHGFRALAVQDSADVAADLDGYVRGGAGSAEAALAGAWRPWRTVETAEALDWIREFNRDHPDDPVRVFGVKPAQARSDDYDAVLGHVRATAPELLADVASHLDPIRTAHAIDEHVQRARGTHPGRPFVAHARDALALIRALPDIGDDDEVVTRMRLIESFHAGSVAGRGNFTSDTEREADALSDTQLRTGLRMVYWDGIAHTAATGTTMGMAPESGLQLTAGTRLRERHGARYVSVAIGFHHGDLGVVTVPEPGADLLDARLGGTDVPARWLDLRHDDVRRQWDGPAKLRVISGVYDPAQDASQYVAVASLADAFDVVVHVRRATPVRWLA